MVFLGDRSVSTYGENNEHYEYTHYTTSMLQKHMDAAAYFRVPESMTCRNIGGNQWNFLKKSRIRYFFMHFWVPGFWIYEGPPGNLELLL